MQPLTQRIDVLLLITAFCVSTPPAMAHDAIEGTGVAPGRLEDESATVISSSTTEVTWDLLQSLAPGTKLRLRLNDGAEVVGHLVSVTPEAVVLDRNKVRQGSFMPPEGSSLKDPLSFARADVSSVEEAKGWPLWAKIVLWAGVAYLAAGAVVIGIAMASD